MALVFVVDDEPAQLLDLRSALEGRGHSTVLAQDGKVALERLAQHRPDVVVLDLVLPVVDGWTVLARLVERDEPPPVVALAAGRDVAGCVRRALDLGAVACLAKPADPPTVVDIVDEVLRLEGPEARDRFRGERRREAGDDA